ncbi:MAG: ABC transporter substrate-binding protein [Alphaproteobacteria bacterium]
MTIHRPASPLTRRAMLAGLASLIGLVGLTAGPVAAAVPSRRFRIYMVTFRGWTDTDRGFKDYLEANRVPVELVVRDAKGDRSALPGIAAEIIREKPDLVYTWGTTASVEILGPYDHPDPLRHVTTVPAVFANVSDPMEARLLPNGSGSGRNVAGSTYLVPMETQIRTLRSYRPVARLAVIYSQAESNSRQAVAEVRRLAAAGGFQVIERPILTPAGEAPRADQLPGLVAEVAAEKADFLYIPPDSFLSTHKKLLTAAALEARLPTFAAAEGTLMGSDALMGLISRYYNIGKLTASLAQRILVGGENPATMPLSTLSRYSLVLNIRVARALGVYPPMRLLKISDVVEDLVEK